MDFLIFIIFGAIAGWLASIIMKTDASQGLLMDIVMGVFGALVGGFLFNTFGQPGVTGFNVYSFIVAIVGSCVVIWFGRLIRGRV